MYGYVYLVKNLITNKIYVGIHKYNKPEIDPRYKGSGSVLKENYKQYGINNHTIELLDTADDRLTLKYLEHFWIALFNSNNPEVGLNQNHGGGGTAEITEETKAIIAKTSSERWQDEDYKTRVCESISNSLKGHTISKATKDKISNTKKGTTAWNKGLIGCYTRSQEAKEKTGTTIKNLHNQKYIDEGFEDYYQTHTDYQCRIKFGQISQERLNEILALLNISDTPERHENLKRIQHENRSKASKERELKLAQQRETK